MKAITAIALFIFTSFSLCAQQTEGEFKKKFDHAEAVFSKAYQNGKNESLSYSKGGYLDARPFLLDLYNQDTANCNLAFKVGVCYLSSKRERIKAIYYFNKAILAVSVKYKEGSCEERNAPLIAYKFLGDAYHLNYQFDKAIEMYKRYISTMAEDERTDPVLLAETKRKIEMCTTALLLVAHPVKSIIQNLDSTVNSAFPDYSPVLSADQNTLFFTSRRPETTGGLKDIEGNYFEDIYRSDKTKSGWSKAENIGAPINTKGNEATVGISPDGQTILIYKDDDGDGNIYSTTLNGDIWSKPIKLNDNINSEFWEPSAFISADGNTIYFSSNRPGGYGGRDLYTSKMLPTGDWAKAVNMGPTINTPFDEDAPFIHPDGVTLYFSSNGHATMGGFDIFTTQLSDAGIWSEPMNVGYPVNTPDDDIYYVVSPDSKTAYFSSFREDGFGEKDNYMITFPDRIETPLTVMKGTVIDETGRPAKDVEITVADNVTGEVVGIYRTNSKTGEFLFILPPGRNYNVTYQSANHLFYSENMDIPKESNYYELKRAIILPPVVVGSKITLNNIFFDFDKATLRKLSNVEINNLVQLMTKNPKIKVEISGHTDSKGSEVYNLRLSEARAQSVVNSLQAKGISKERMQAKGYGKSKPVAPNSNPDGTDNPEGRQKNRRVEFKIIGIN